MKSPTLALYGVLIGAVLTGCGGSGYPPNPSPTPTPTPAPTPPPGTMTEFPAGDVNNVPFKLVAGTDGNLWLFLGCCPEFGTIAKVTTSGTVTGVNAVTGLLDFTFGPDGNLWAVTLNPELVKMTTSGTEQIFSAPKPGGEIIVGPDNNLWVASSGEIDVYSTAGTHLHTFPSDTPSNVGISGMASGPDGNVWFFSSSPSNPNEVVAVSMTTSGVVTTYPLPQLTSTAGCGFAKGPDGNLWFCDGNNIGRLTTAGALTLFAIPTPNSMPSGIAAGPDGNLWFVELVGNNVGRITPTGVVAEFTIPTANSAPTWIVAGPDGFMWFTERHGLKVGKVHL